MGRSGKNMRREKLNNFKNNELPKLQKMYSIVEFNIGSFRITHNGLTVDYFPSADHFFNHNTGERGGLSIKITEYIDIWTPVNKDKPEQKVLPIQNEAKRVFLEWIIKRGKEVKKELATVLDKDLRKGLNNRLKNLKALYIKENTLTTNNT